MFAGWGRFVYRNRWATLIGSGVLLATSVVLLMCSFKFGPFRFGQLYGEPLKIPVALTVNHALQRFFDLQPAIFH